MEHLSIWKSNLLKRTQVISDVEKCGEALQHIRSKLNPENEEKMVIGMDCEGVDLGEKGMLTLVQISTDKLIYIFDVLSCPDILNEEFKNILEDPAVVKVIHSCRNDVLNLFYEFNIHLKGVFDCQIAHSILTQQNTGVRAPKVGLNVLYKAYGLPINPLKDKLKNIYKIDSKYWANRPLSEEMILYAAADVEQLINDKLYYSMRRTLNPGNLRRVEELSKNQTIIHRQRHNIRTQQNRSRHNFKRYRNTHENRFTKRKFYNYPTYFRRYN